MEIPADLTFAPKAKRFDLNGTLGALHGGPVILTASELSTLRKQMKSEMESHRNAKGRALFSASRHTTEPLTYVVWMDGTPTSRS